MSFCPICKRNHDPDLNCLDGTSQTLRDMGIKKSKEMPKEEFKKLSKKVTTVLIIIAILIFWGVILLIFLSGEWRRF